MDIHHVPIAPKMPVRRVIKRVENLPDKFPARAVTILKMLKDALSSLPNTVDKEDVCLELGLMLSGSDWMRTYQSESSLRLAWSEQESDETFNIKLAEYQEAMEEYKIRKEEHDAYVNNDVVGIKRAELRRRVKEQQKMERAIRKNAESIKELELEIRGEGNSRDEFLAGLPEVTF